MTDPEPIARIRIGLAEIRPEIWRRVEAPLALSLKGLHDVIQAAMGWLDYHLFEFRIGDRLYGIPEPDWDGERQVKDAKNIKLAALVAEGIDRFDYVYDFGDDWLHCLAIEAIIPADPKLKYPRFVDGARSAPPEDVGGPHGYQNFLQAIANPRHPDHRDLTEWSGGFFEPDEFDEFDARRSVAAIAKRRHAGLAAARKRKAKG